jgi:hypothetical protein
VASVSFKLVRSVMAELGLAGCQARACKTITRPTRIRQASRLALWAGASPPTSPG